MDADPVRRNFRFTENGAGDAFSAYILSAL